VNWIELLNALGDIAPPVIAVIVLTAVIYVFLNVIVPATNAVTALLNAQTQSAVNSGEQSREQVELWRELVAETKTLNERALEEVRKELKAMADENKRLDEVVTELRCELEKKNDELVRQNEQILAQGGKIAALQSEVNQLRKQDQDKDEKLATQKEQIAAQNEQIKELTRQLEEMKRLRDITEAERNELKNRLDVLEQGNGDAKKA
jgi:chromosome segregation ATPase